MARILASFLFSLILPVSLFAQSGNPFLSMDYWEGNPSIAEIDTEIIKGHSVTESSNSGFDATSYAILGRAPFETVTYLLGKGIDVNTIAHGASYVYWAGYRGNLPLVKHLIENGASIEGDESDNYTMLLFSALGGELTPEMADYLISQGSDLKNEVTPKGANALHLTSYKFTDVAQIEYFTDRGIDLHATDNEGNGIFYYASRSGNIELLDNLIEMGVEYQGNNSKGGNAFLSAVRNRENPVSFFEYLEGLGLEPNVKTDAGYTPLHRLAFVADNTEAIEWFVAKGVDPNKVDTSSGNTPLINAVFYNDSTSVIEYFAERTDNVNHQNNNGYSALTRAVRSASVESTNYLLELGADALVLDKNGSNLYSFLLSNFDADAEEEFIAKFELLRENGLDEAALQGNGKTLYHLAADNGDIALFKLIAELTSIDINAKDHEGYTALHHMAMKAKDDSALKYLLSIGANKHTTTDFEESPFDLASENELLLDNGTNLDFLSSNEE
ncbi:MAG: ankyrin repeat domain-containing protein [Bacteroidota bacterium]